MTLEIRIYGKVQGVWFRASAKDEALRLRLTGKVWNEPDGSVGVLVQGDAESIQSFIDWCKQGPPLARVQEVQGAEVVTTEVFTGFDITGKPR